MAETTPQVSETFEAKADTKQFTLGASFEKYAKTKGLSEQGIKMAKTEIEDRFAKFNTEGMDDRRFRNVRGTIESIINNEIGKAQSLLASRSEALTGTSIKPNIQPVAYTPEIKLPTPAASPDKGVVTGLFNAIPVTRDATTRREAAMKAAGV